MQFEKITKMILYLGIAFWLILAAFRLVSYETLYTILGVLVLFLAGKNIYLLYQSRDGVNMHIKVQECVNRMGYRNGIIYYVTFMIGIFLLVGVLLVVYGLKG